MKLFRRCLSSVNGERILKNVVLLVAELLSTEMRYEIIDILETDGGCNFASLIKRSTKCDRIILPL